MRIKQSVVILAITGSKNKHTIRSGMDWTGAFKKFAHFFRNSFFPVTKCVVENKQTTSTITENGPTNSKDFSLVAYCNIFFEGQGVKKE